MGCKYIHLTGGEPTTRPDLLDIVRLIRSFGIRVGISTNGSRRLTYYEELVEAGIELFSLSLDVHQRDLNNKFTMVPSRVFDVVVSNIRELSKMVYTNVGVVFNDDNADKYREIIEFISGLGAHDIRIMTATKYNKILAFELDSYLLDKHPILKFRVENFNAGRNMRGSGLAQTPRCHLVRDDITIFGEDFYSCAVYVREGGSPIGKFGTGNIELREAWFDSHNSHRDELCSTYCMDFKCQFNDRVEAV
jgi:MoaA/NifB/PqqE/SkfB family radical SAM enzyme